MKKIHRVALRSALIAGLIASTPQLAVAAEGQPAPQSLPSPPAGTGQIVFWRPGTLVGAALGCGVNIGAERISALGKGKYFLLNLVPGAYEFNAKSEAKDTLNMEVEAGEVYYVKCTIRMGIMAGRPNLAPSTATEFAGKRDSLKYVDADDRGSRVAADPGTTAAASAMPASGPAADVVAPSAASTPR